METQEGPQGEHTQSVDYVGLFNEAKAEVQADQPQTPEQKAYDPAKRAQELIAAHKAEGDRAIAVLESDLLPRSPSPDRRQALENEQQNLLDAMRTQAEMRKPVSRIGIRLNLSTVDKIIIEKQEFKPLAGSGMTNALKDAEAGDRLQQYTLRRKEEELKAGLKQADTEPDVIYGFLEETDTLAERSQAALYGDAELILKPDVVQRSTFTTNDSLNMGYRPIDFDNAVYARQLRDLVRQRGLSYREEGSAPYIEAQILGGVKAEDVEQIAISHKEVTLLQDAEGNVTRDDLVEVFEQADRLRAAAPDVKLMLRLDIERSFNRQRLLEYANAHPDVQLALFVDASPGFLAGATERRREYEGEGRLGVDLEADAQRSQEAARQRLDQAKTNLLAYQQNQLQLADLPPNISFHTALHQNYV